MNLFISIGENKSPLPSTGILIRPVSIILLTIYHLAGTLLSSAWVLEWIDMKCIPQSYIAKT